VTRALSVWWDGVVVGTLRVNQHGQMRFTYASGWLADAARPAISFSLPKQEQPFTHRQCRPFFAGLLPEEAQREMIAGALGISQGNDFAFLEALGGDVAGALSLARRRSTASTRTNRYASAAQRRGTGRRAGHAPEATAARRP
jgi:serine/threonine-protein kinase HipA